MELQTFYGDIKQREVEWRELMRMRGELHLWCLVRRNRSRE